LCGDATKDDKDFELTLETTAAKKKKWGVHANVKKSISAEFGPF